MSAMADTPLCPPATPSQSRTVSAFRDLLLALCLTVLAALAMQAADAPVPNTAPITTEWRGNSGSLINTP